VIRRLLELGICSSLRAVCLAGNSFLFSEPQAVSLAAYAQRLALETGRTSSIFRCRTKAIMVVKGSQSRAWITAGCEAGMCRVRIDPERCLRLQITMTPRG